MATTLSAATLTVKITESILLNGSDQGATNTLSIGTIKQVQKRIVTCLASVDTTVALFNTQVNVEDGGIDTQDCKYIRITNLDDTNPINLNLQIDTTESGSGVADANENATILLEAGHSFIMGTSHDSISAYDSDASAQTTLHDLESILVDPGSNAVDVEVFIASV